MTSTTPRTLPALLEKITNRISRTHGGDITVEERIDPTDALSVLSFARRRYAIEHLATHDTNDSIPVGELAEYVAAQENDCSIKEVTSDERSRVYIALIQQHLPQLDRHNLVDYDANRKTLEPTDDCTRVWRAYQNFRDDLTG